MQYRILSYWIWIKFSKLTSATVSIAFLSFYKIKVFDFFNHFVEKFSCELICMLIRYIEIEWIHRQSHRRMCNHWELTQIHIWIISISFFVCSRSNNNSSFSECFWTMMKCRITSKQWVSITKWNDSSQIWRVKYRATCKLWLSLTNYKSDFKS